MIEKYFKYEAEWGSNLESRSLIESMVKILGNILNGSLIIEIICAECPGD